MTQMQIASRATPMEGHLYAACVRDDGSVLLGGATRDGGILITVGDASVDSRRTQAPIVGLAPAMGGGYFFCDGSSDIGWVQEDGETARIQMPMKRALSVATTTKGVCVGGYLEPAEPYAGDWYSDPHHFGPDVLHETSAGSPDVPTSILAYAEGGKRGEALKFNVLHRATDFSRVALLSNPCVESAAMVGVCGRRPRAQLWRVGNASVEKMGLKSGDFLITSAVVSATGALLVGDNRGRIHRSVNDGESFRKKSVVDVAYTGLNVLVCLSNGWIVAAGDGGVIAVSKTVGRTFEVQDPVGEGRATSWKTGGFHYYTGAPLKEGVVLAGTRGRLDYCTFR